MSGKSKNLEALSGLLLLPDLSRKIEGALLAIYVVYKLRSTGQRDRCLIMVSIRVTIFKLWEVVGLIPIGSETTKFFLEFSSPHIRFIV